MRSIRSWLRGLAVASSLLAGAASAQTYDHSVYLDLDNNVATGCSVATAAGPVNGAEVRITATVSGTPPMVTASTRALCAGGVFGTPQPQAAAYAVGLNNGINGSDVVEIATPLAGLGQGGPARATFVSSGAGGADLASGVVQFPGGGAVAPVEPVLVPATGIIALLVIVGLVLLLARRHPAFGSSLALLLVLGAGAVWAANFVVDGQVGDWAGVAPLAMDANGDSTSADPRIEIVAVFAATENGNLFLRVDVQDAQTPTNTAPVLNDTAFSVPENSAAGTAVGTAAATDANAGQTLAYSITGGNAAGGFAINAGTGAITVANAAALDFETTPNFALTVTVTDNGIPAMSDTATITVALGNVNEAPVLADATRAVAEDSPAGTAVGVPLAATDVDAGSSFTYAITAGNTNGAFAIANSGQITVANAAAVANTGTFNLTVVVTDNGGLTDSAAVTVNVTDQNDAPAFTGAPYAFTLAENASAGAAVGSAAATDADAGQTLAYAITGGNTGNAFAINPATGAITVATPAAVDFEANPSFTLTLTVTDDGAPPLSATTTATVTLTDVNEAPVASDGAFAVAENAPAATPVGTVVATDPDLDPPNPPSANATLTYAITAGNTANTFAIDAATGAITVANTPVLANSPFTLTVTVTDGGALSDTATITITVTDQNDAPTASDAAFSLPENSAAGTAVGSVTATDPDAGQALSFAITAGNGAGGFAIDAATGAITVANAAALDFETTPGFTLTVTVTDNGTPSLNDTATVTVDLTNANDAPVANDTGFTLAENSANGTVAGTFGASDADAGQVLSYAITGGTGQGFFAIDASTGQITVTQSSALDFETAPTFTLIVTATDDGAPAASDTALVTITLTDANDAPVATDAAFTVLENSAAGTAVGSVAASDADAGANGTLSFAITAGNTNGAFAIDASTGAITVANQAEMDFGVVFNLTVTVTDGGALSDTAAVTITVDDVNEAPVPTASPVSPVALAEDTAPGTTVTTIAPNDPEPGQTHTYAFQSGNTGNAFAISAAGVVTVAGALDFEGADDPYTLVVRVTDNGTPSLFADLAFTVTLTDVNEAPQVTAGGTLSYQEADPATAIDGSVTVFDPDAGEGIESAVVQISANLAAGQDVLALPPTAGFVANYTAATGTLAITGSATPAAWEAVLRSVTYVNTSGAPSTAARTVSWTVNDGALASNTATSTITVGADNSAPVFTSSIPTAATEDTLYTYTPAITDPDGPGQAWTIDAANTCAGAGIVAGTGVYTFTPAGPVPPASCVVAVRVCDGGAPDQCATQSATVTINAVNDPPVIDSVAPATATEDQAYAYDATFTDPDGTGSTWSTIAGNTCGGSINAASGQYTFTPAGPITPPSCDIAIQVCDGGAQCGTQTSTVSITAVNSAPSFTSSVPASATEDVAYNYAPTIADADGPGQAWTLDGANTCAGATINPATGAYAFTPAGPVPPASCVVAIQVCDTGTPDQCVVQSGTVTITPANDAPTIDSSAPATATEDVAYTYNATFTDGDGPGATWSLLGTDTCGGSIVPATGVYTFTPAGPNPPASCVVAIQVCDGGSPNECGPQSTTVAITAVNDTPVNTVPGAQIVDEDTNLVFSAGNGNAISIADPDATTMRATLTASNGVVTLGSTTGLTFTTGDGTADATVAFNGTLANVNAALAGLVFRGNPNYFGPAGLTVASDDNGSTGGGALTDSDGIAITVNPVNDAPAATAKAHSTHSGLGLTINAATHTGELKEGATDVDDAFGELTVEIIAGSATPAEAAVTLISAADGSFHYDPPGGYTGSGGFQFRVCDDNAGDPNRCSAATAVSFTVTGTQTWFIDDTDAAGCGAGCTGTRTRPLVGLGNGDAQFAARGTGDSVFVFSGSYTTGFAMAANERLVGQGASAIQASLAHVYTGFSNGTLDGLPVQSTPPTVGGTVTLANNAFVRGIAISATAATGLSASAASGVDVDEASVTSTGTAVSFNNVGGTVTLSNTSSSGGTQGIALIDVSGTHAFGNGALGGHTTASFVLNNTGNVSSTVTYGGTINPAAAGRVADIGTGVANSGLRGGSVTLSGNIGNVSATNAGISMRNGTGGSLTLSGTQKRINSGAGTAVLMSANTGGALSFTNGGLDIDTSSGVGIDAAGAGSLTISGTGNSVNSTANTAVQVNGIVSALNFQRIDSAGADNGISLQNTGPGPATLVVVGTGSAGSGGTLNNFTGANGATAGNALHLVNVTGVDLAWMQVSNAQNNGLLGSGVANLQLNNMVFNGNHGNTAAGPFYESAVQIAELSGNVDFVNSIFNGGFSNGIRIQNNTALTLDFTYDNNDITFMQGTTADVGGSALLLSTFAGNVTSNIKNSTFTFWWGNAVHTLFQGTVTGVSRITGNTVDNDNGALAGAGGIAVGGGTVNYLIANNTVRDTNGTAISADRFSAGSLMHGVIENNQVGVAGVNNSGSTVGTGIFLSHTGPAETRALVRNNTVRQVGANNAGAVLWMVVGDALTGGGSGTNHFTVTGNTIAESGSPMLSQHHGILVTHGRQSGPPNDTDVGCYDIGGSTPATRNTLTGINSANPGSENRIRVNQRFGTTSRWPGYTGQALGVASQTDIGTYLLGRNTASNSVNANTSTGGFTNTIPAGSACTQPNILLPL